MRLQVAWERRVNANRRSRENRQYCTRDKCFSERNPWVAMLVKDSKASYEIIESLNDFRYEPNTKLRVCPSYTHPSCV